MGDLGLDNLRYATSDTNFDVTNQDVIYFKRHAQTPDQIINFGNNDPTVKDPHLQSGNTSFDICINLTRASKLTNNHKFDKLSKIKFAVNVIAKDTANG
jgi:hypothetical protein